MISSIAYLNFKYLVNTVKTWMLFGESNSLNGFRCLCRICRSIYLMEPCKITGYKIKNSCDEKYLLKWMQQPDESISQLIIWWNFVPYLSVSSKGKFSINVILKPLLLVVRMKKSTKSGKRLQNKGWSSSLSSFTFFSANVKILKFRSVHTFSP